MLRRVSISIPLDSLYKRHMELLAEVNWRSRTEEVEMGRGKLTCTLTSFWVLFYLFLTKTNLSSIKIQLSKFSNWNLKQQVPVEIHLFCSITEVGPSLPEVMANFTC